MLITRGWWKIRKQQMNGKIEQLAHDCNVDYIKARRSNTIKKGTPIICI